MKFFNIFIFICRNGYKAVSLPTVKRKINALFSCDMHQMEQKQTILEKINRSKKGTIFLPDSFPPISTRYAANVLAELEKEGKLVRVTFGIYVKPRRTRFGLVMPTLYEIARAISKRDASKILPSGPTAENYLGFSTQVPMNAVYLTSGTPRKLKIGNRSLTLRHSVPKTFAFKGEIMPILVLALKSIGKDDINDEILDNVYGVLKAHPEDDTWQADIKLAPLWIRNIITLTKKRLNQHEQMD